MGLTQAEKIANAKAISKAFKDKQAKELENYWENLPAFLKPYDVPALPNIHDDEKWKNYYVPRIIKAGGIPSKDLIHGATYSGRTRNATHAMWDAEKREFIHYRSKYGHRYRDTVNHFEDDNGFALFVPIKLIRK